MAGQGLGDTIHTSWSAGKETFEHRQKLFDVYNAMNYGLVDVRGIKDPKTWYQKCGAFPPFLKKPMLRTINYDPKGRAYGRMAIYHGPLKGYNADDIVEGGAPEPAFAFCLIIVRNTIEKDGDNTRPNKSFVYTCIMGKHQYDIILRDIKDDKTKRELLIRRCKKIFPVWWDYFLSTTKLHGDIELFGDPGKFESFRKKL